MCIIHLFWRFAAPKEIPYYKLKVLNSCWLYGAYNYVRKKQQQKIAAIISNLSDYFLINSG